MNYCREVVNLAHFPIHFAVGETSLLGLAALLKQCQGAIVNDGGPLHVAEAVGVKTVSILAPLIRGFTVPILWKRVILSYKKIYHASPATVVSVWQAAGISVVWVNYLFKKFIERFKASYEHPVY